MSKDWKNISTIEGVYLTKPDTHIHINSLSEDDRERLLDSGYAISRKHCHDQKRTLIKYTTEGAKCL